MRVLALALAAMAAAACGGSASTGVGGNTTCTETATGAQSVTLDCTNHVLGTYTTGNNAGAISISAPATGSGSVSGGTTISFSGEPTAKTYKTGDAGLIAFIQFGSSSNLWVVQNDGTSSSSNQGTFTLTVSSVNTVTTGSGAKIYTIHGTMDAVAPAYSSTSATGTVNLHTTF